MDNVKTDSYYIEKIQRDLEFIVNHMRNVINARRLRGRKFHWYALLFCKVEAK